MWRGLALVAKACAVGVVLVLAGCGRGGDKAGAPADAVGGRSETAQDEAPSAATKPTPPASAGDPRQALDALESDANSYVQNNAKEARRAWDEKEYKAAVIALQQVLSVSKTETQRGHVFECLGALREELRTAAEAGNRDAKEALEHLAGFF